MTKQKIPLRSCFYCKDSSIRCYSVICRNEESLYFETIRKKTDHCPEFKQQEKKQEKNK